MSHFDLAFRYAILNEGEQSNHPADRGGLTRWGITEGVAKAHRCMIHPVGIDVKKVNLDLARHIYLEDYWVFDGVKDATIAVKLFDMGVNFGVKTAVRLAQETINVMSKANLKVDGVLGKSSCAELNKLHPQKFLDQLEYLADDRYVDIVLNNRTQLVFLKGWLRRSNKRFYVS